VGWGPTGSQQSPERPSSFSQSDSRPSADVRAARALDSVRLLPGAGERGALCGVLVTCIRPKWDRPVLLEQVSGEHCVAVLVTCIRPKSDRPRSGLTRPSKREK
jgi:hypothetical protein